MRLHWRDLILRVWGTDPLQCPQGHHEPSGGGSRETDHDEGVALKRSGREREPEEATESMSWTPSSAPEKSHSSSAFKDFGNGSGADIDCRRQPEGWSGSDINESSTSRHRPTRPSTSKNAEGSEAFWTQAKPEPAGRARQAGRANQTFEPIEPAWQAIREWIPDDDADPSFNFFGQRPDSGKPVEIRREDGSTLVLDSE